MFCGISFFLVLKLYLDRFLHIHDSVIKGCVSSYSSLKANLRTGIIHVGIHTRNIPKALVLHAHWKHMLVAIPLHYLLHAPNNICLLTVAPYKGNDLLRPLRETVVVYV